MRGLVACLGRAASVSREASPGFDVSRAFLARNVLTADECASLVAHAEGIGFEESLVDTRGMRRAGDAGAPVSLKKVRNNDRMVLDDAAFALSLFVRLSSVLPETFGGMAVHSLSERIRFYRYVPGQFFKRHFDGAFRDDAAGTQLVHTILVYLNAVESGGQTLLFSAPSAAPVTVEPQRGLAVCFFHHTLHEGVAVEAGVKYVLRCDSMYRRVH